MTDISPLLPTKTFESVSSWLADFFNSGQGWEIDLVQSKGTPGRERRIFRVQDRSGRKIALKAHSLRTRNRNEYRALSNLHRARADSIATLHLSRDLSFYAMDWADAPLVRDGLAGEARLRLIGQTGAWLAGLHSAKRQIWIPNYHRPNVDLKRSAGTGPVDEATDTIRQRLRAVRFKSGPRAVLHGDFHSGNLFDFTSQVKVFDRERDFYGLTYLDMGRFLADLAQLRAEAALRGAPWDGSAEEDRRAFFEAYGAIAERDLALFDAVEDAFVFRTWRRQMRRNDASPLTGEIHLRGLLARTPGSARPARLVQGADNRILWTAEEPS